MSFYDSSGVSLGSFLCKDLRDIKMFISGSLGIL